MSEFAKTPQHVQQAISYVEDFAFVGDVAQWNLSICLFNRILTGRRRRRRRRRRAAAAAVAARPTTRGVAELPCEERCECR